MALSGSHVRYMTGVVASATKAVNTGVRLYMKLQSAVIASTTSVLGGVLKRQFLNGVIASATSVLGGVTQITAVVIDYLSGAISSSTAILGRIPTLMLLTDYWNVTGVNLLNGTVSCATAVSDGLKLSFRLGNSIVSGTAVNARMNLNLVLSGAIQSTTAVLGGVTRIAAVVIEYLSGIIQSVTAVNAGLKLSLFFNGVIETFTSILGGVSRIGTAAIDYLGGVIQSATSIVGRIPALMLLTDYWNVTGVNILSGAINCASSVSSPAFNLLHRLAGTIASGTSVVMGFLGGIGTRLLGGAIQSMTSLIGGVTRSGLVQQLLGGIIACATFIGNFDPTAWFPLGWFGPGWFSDFSGVPIRLGMHLKASIASTTSVLGSVFAEIAGRLLGGAIVCSTAVISNLQKLTSQLIAGTIVCSTAILGMIRRGLFFSGVIASVSAVVGNISRKISLVGSILTNSFVTANLTQRFTRLLGGAIACGTFIIGNVINIGNKFIGGVIGCSTYVFTYMGNFGGLGGLGRHFIHWGHKIYLKAKERLRIEP